MLDVPTARALLCSSRPRRQADGYPAHVRTSVVALVRAQLTEGRSLNAVAVELDVSRGTLHRWLMRSTEVASTFVPVLVSGAFDLAEQEREDVTLHLGSSGSLALVSPTGFRLDGLCLDDAIHALRQLS
jgi:hypothetical protein